MRTRLFALASVLVPSIAQAEVVPLQSLEDRAVSRSPALRVARATVNGALADGDEAAAARMPILGIRAEGSVSPGGELVHAHDVDGERFSVLATPELSDSHAFTPVPRYGATASARWRLLDFGRSGAAEHAADLGAEAGRMGERAAEREIRIAVRRAYLGWAVAAERRAIAAEGAAAAAGRAARVQELIRRGQRPDAEGAAAAVDQATARLELARAEARLASARATLEGAVGEALATDATPDPGFLEATPQADAEDPTDRSLQAQRAAAGALADAQSYRYRPTLDLEADAGMRGQSDSLFPVYRGAVVLSLPLYDGGVGSARERGARADAARLDAELDLHRRTREAEAAIAASAAEHAGETRAAAHALVEAARARLAAAEAAYDRGVGSPSSSPPPAKPSAAPAPKKSPPKPSSPPPASDRGHAPPLQPLDFTHLLAATLHRDPRQVRVICRLKS